METAQELAHAQLEAVFAQDWARLEALYDPDVHYLDPDGEMIGRTAVTDRVKALAAALPGCTFRIRHCTASDDAAVVEWTLSGEGIGLEVATVYEGKDGRITAERNYWDSAALAGEPDGVE